MPSVHMKGVHKVTRPLAGGGQSVHFYAWRGGPKITAAPGSAAFFAEWQALTATRDTPPAHHAGTLQAIINAYQDAPAFLDLAAETRAGYIRRIAKIELQWGSLPIRALSDPRVRGDLLDWRDGIARTAPREADYCMTVLGRILSWAYDRRRVPCNPAERPGRVWRGSRVDQVWTEEGLATLLAACPDQLRLPVLLALHTGQREGDILRLTWTAYDGATIRLRQSKGGRRVALPVTADLKAALDATRKVATTICTNSKGQPWTQDGFQSTWQKHKPAGLTFHDLRGTAVTRLALAGCSEAEIASMTGHSLKSVSGILDRHYLHRDQRMSESAVAKLEKHASGTAAVNAPVNGPGAA